MDIKFEHRIWRTFANLVSEVRGPGYNKYRTTKIRLLLTVARRLEWVGNLSHFDAMLSEKADMYISTGRWSGSKQDAMRYLFYMFISDRAADYAKHFTFGKRDRRTMADWPEPFKRSA